MAHYFKRKTISVALLITTFGFVASAVFSGTVSAGITYWYPVSSPNSPTSTLTWYPDPGENRDPVGTVIVTKPGVIDQYTEVTLNTPISNIRIFYKLSDINYEQTNINVRAKDCSFNDIGDDNANYQIQKISNVDGDRINWETIPGQSFNYSGCEYKGGPIRGGNDPNITFTISKNDIKKAPSYYGDDWGVIQVRAEKIGGIGIANFIVGAGDSSARVTFAEQDRDQTAATQNTSGGALSIWNGSTSSLEKPGNLSSQFNFSFKPDCSYTETKNSFYLKWTDADDGIPNQAYRDENNQSEPISFKLFRSRNGGSEEKILERGPGTIGANGDYREAEIKDLQEKDTFRWEWNNVSRKNGVQFWLPFSEANNVITCDLPKEKEPEINVVLNNYEKGMDQPPVKLGIKITRNFENAINCSRLPKTIDGTNGLKLTHREGFMEPPERNDILQIGEPEISMTQASINSKSTSCVYERSGITVGLSEPSDQLNNLSNFLNNTNLPHSYKLKYKYTTPDQKFSAEQEGTGYVIEVPYANFSGNDVRACSSTNDSKFMFDNRVPANGATKGSYSFWSSVWKSGDFGGFNGLKTYGDENMSKRQAQYNNMDCIGSGLAVPNKNNPETPTATISGNYTGFNSKYASGDITINNNIITDMPTNYSDVANPPVYWIKANNIYINNSVTKLQGVILIADNIYTCTEGATNKTVLHTNCNNPLKIEGAIFAKNLKLLRSTGTRYLASNPISQQTVPGNNQPAEWVVYPTYFNFTNIYSSNTAGTKGRIDNYMQAAPRL